MQIAGFQRDICSVVSVPVMYVPFINQSSSRRKKGKREEENNGRGGKWRDKSYSEQECFLARRKEREKGERRKEKRRIMQPKAKEKPQPLTGVMHRAPVIMWNIHACKPCESIVRKSNKKEERNNDIVLHEDAITITLLVNSRARETVFCILLPPFLRSSRRSRALGNPWAKEKRTVSWSKHREGKRDQLTSCTPVPPLCIVQVGSRADSYLGEVSHGILCLCETGSGGFASP